MAAVGVARRVRVVLEEEDLAFDPVLVEACLGALDEAREDPLPRLVLGDEVLELVALRRRVLGVAADVEVEARAVLQEDVGGAAPVHDAPEEVARDLVGAQPALAAVRERDAELALEPEDPVLHGSRP